MRTINKLRISVTEACQFRCTYCMPENSSFKSNDSYLPLAELFELTKKLVIDRNVKKIRVTGGEPLVRPGLKSFLKDLTILDVPISITTNAFLLDEFLCDLKAMGILDLNISLDSLSELSFQNISRTHSKLRLEKVLKNIDMAVEMGFKIKTNTVLMKSNFHENINICEWAFERGIHPRFLELMSLGEANKIFKSEFVPKSELMKLLESHYGSSFQLNDEKDSTSKNYLFSFGKSFGVIASETEPFCENCSRIRLNAFGELFGCLMKNESINLNNKEANFSSLVDEAIQLKPHFRIYDSEVLMNRIGG